MTRPACSPSARPAPRLPLRSWAPVLALAASTVVLAGCSPALDWRTLRPLDGELSFMLPCKPSSHERRLPLAGGPVLLGLQACSAGGQTWGLATADLGDPARVAAALQELADGAVRNVGGPPVQRRALAVPGATPHPASGWLSAQGRQPDGRPLQLQAAVFAHGTRVYQATVIGQQIPAEAAETFFSSLTLAR